MTRLTREDAGARRETAGRKNTLYEIMDGKTGSLVGRTEPCCALLLAMSEPARAAYVHVRRELA